MLDFVRDLAGSFLDADLPIMQCQHVGAPRSPEAELVSHLRPINWLSRTP